MAPVSYMGQNWRGKPLPSGLDLSKTALVVVTGTPPNSCGHVLLFVGGGFGNYFHFNGPSFFDYPKYMTEEEYRAFLHSEGKEELLRRQANLPYPQKAAAKLLELLNGKWLTFLVSHNCASFAGEVLQAGGNRHLIPDHCPAMDLASEKFWDRIFSPIRQKLGTEDAYQSRFNR